MSLVRLLSILFILGIVVSQISGLVCLWLVLPLALLLLAAQLLSAGLRQSGLAGLLCLAAAFCGGLYVGAPGSTRATPTSIKSRDHVVHGVVVSTSRLEKGRGRIRLRADGLSVASPGRPSLLARQLPNIPISLSAPSEWIDEVERGDRVSVRARGLEAVGVEDLGRLERLGQQWLTARAAAPPLEHAREGGAAEALSWLRSRIRSNLVGAVSTSARGLVLALSIGDRDHLRASDVLAFRRSGTAHLLAISGLHVSIVTTVVLCVCLFVFRRTSLAAMIYVPLPAALCAALATWLYAALAGLTPSVTRAAIMATLALAAFAARRSRNARDGVVLAAALLLSVEPALLFSVGAQLSFAAVLALCEAGQWADHGSSRGKGNVPKGAKVRALRLILRVAVASGVATAVTSPLLAHHFGAVTPLGVVWNILLVPLTSLFVLPACLLLSLSAVLSEPLAATLGIVVSPLLDVFLSMVGVLSRVPGSTAHTMRPTLVEALALSSAVIAISGPPVRRRALVAFILVAAALTSMAYRAWEPTITGRMRLTVIDVGSGSAVLLEAPRAGRILIDGGPDGGTPGRMTRVTRLLTRRGFGRLRAIAVTHRHEDHVAGVAEVFERLGALELWQPLTYQGGGRGALVDRARDSNALLFDTVGACGEPFAVGSVGVEVLHPCPPYVEPGFSENNRSLVLRIVMGEVSFLLPGDIESEAEAKLVTALGERLGSTVLLLAHHGSATSSSEVFLQAVRPRLALSSCGARGRGAKLPHSVVRERLRRRAIPLLTTAAHGSIEVETDGRELVVGSSRLGRQAMRFGMLDHRVTNHP